MNLKKKAMGGLMKDKFATSWTESGLRALAAQHVCSDTTRHWQDKALSCFIDNGYPTHHVENWRYMSLHDVLSENFSYPQPGALTQETLAPYRIAHTQQLVFIDGYLSLELSDLDSSLVILPLNELLQTADDSLLREFKIELEQPFFAGLNSALMREGCYIKVAANKAVLRPLHILHVSTAAASKTQRHPRILLDVDRNAEVTVFEEFVSMGGEHYVMNAVTQLHLNFDARAHYYKLQREADTATHLATTMGILSADSTLNYHVFSLGAKLSREEVQCRHFEPGSAAALTGLFMPTQQQQMAHNTRVDHFRGHTTTTQHYRGVAADQAQGVFDGQVVIHPGASQSSIQQQNHNLILSDQAEIDTKPNLEIYVDDVVASHGATIGQLDQQALFYMRSRGLDEVSARRLLIQSFTNSLLETLPKNDVTTYIRSQLSVRDF